MVGTVTVSVPIYVERTNSTVVRSSFVDLPTMDELEAFLEWTVWHMGQRDGAPLFVVMDIRRAPTPPLDHLKRHAAFFKEHAELIRGAVTGVVFVAQSPMLRGALKALFWMQAPPTDVSVARDLDDARELLRPMLTAAGVKGAAEPFDDNPATQGEEIRP